MKSCNCTDKKVKTEYLGDVQIDLIESFPEFILAERDVTDHETGIVVRSLVRVPSGRLFPNGTMANVFPLVGNNPDIIIPERQVRAGVVKNLVSSTQVQYADEENPAMFLLIGTLADMLLAQRNGVINLPNGHDYVISQQYYTSTDGSGEPTTDPESGQKLFIPISRTQLLITF